ncbi:hypothetical protein ACQ4M3_08020 [Leptolyngbya sp. AN03gr2]|uniref:hypothetical protein n=1 Tax=unclassified Leptolyngbya TaxID=2650499 RepID=UPI003D313DA4
MKYAIIHRNGKWYAGEQAGQPLWGTIDQAVTFSEQQIETEIESGKATKTLMAVIDAADTLWVPHPHYRVININTNGYEILETCSGERMVGDQLFVAQDP